MTRRDLFKLLIATPFAPLLTKIVKPQPFTFMPRYYDVSISDIVIVGDERVPEGQILMIPPGWKFTITDSPKYGCGWLNDDGIFHEEVRDSKTHAVLESRDTKWI